MPAAKMIVTIRDGKGKTANVLLHSEVLDDTDLTNGATYESMGDNLLQDLEPVIDGEIVEAHWLLPVGFDFTPQTADPDSDVEEGALFIWETADGYQTRTRIPTFKESMLVAGSRLVDLTIGAVQDFVNTMIDGPDALAGVPEDRFNMTTNRGEDITVLRAAYELFLASRKFLGN